MQEVNWEITSVSQVHSYWQCAWGLLPMWSLYIEWYVVCVGGHISRHWAGNGVGGVMEHHGALLSYCGPIRPCRGPVRAPGSLSGHEASLKEDKEGGDYCTTDVLP